MEQTNEVSLTDPLMDRVAFISFFISDTFTLSFETKHSPLKRHLVLINGDLVCKSHLVILVCFVLQIKGKQQAIVKEDVTPNKLQGCVVTHVPRFQLFNGQNISGVMNHVYQPLYIFNMSLT